MGRKRGERPVDDTRAQEFDPAPDAAGTGGTADSTAVSKDLDVNEAWIFEHFARSHDVHWHRIKFETATEPVSVLLVYCEGMADVKRINSVILPNMRHFFARYEAGNIDDDALMNEWQISSVLHEARLDRLAGYIYQGQLAVLIEGLVHAYILDISDPPARVPSEASTEVSVRGPRDGFTEELVVNVALIRKRLNTDSLCFEQFTIGRRTASKVGLLYLRDVIDPAVLQEIRTRLRNMKVESLTSTSDLEEELQKPKWAFFPIMDYTGRPDYAAESLLTGRFVLVVEGSPTVIIAPVNIYMLINSPEDLHNPYFFVTFQRLSRLFGLLVALFLPGFYVAILTFHMDHLPLTLLATFFQGRKGTPLPAPIEAFLMLLTFETFREAGMRLPTAIGQTLAVVGGLIIGDAAIRAGLTSPSMLVITGTTAVATFTLVNQSLAGAISVVRFLILIASSFLGIFGFLAASFFLLLYLSRMNSFGVPYLSPITPVSFQDFLHALLRLPKFTMQKRPKSLHTVDSTRRGDSH